MNRIQGKIAVVTGFMQGLGRAIAALFAKAGAAGIVIVGRGVEMGERAAAEITAATGVLVMMIGSDLGRIEDVRAIIPRVDERFGRVDIHVNAAGLTDRGTMFNTDPALLDRMIAVNTRAPFFLIQDAGKVMDREGIERRIVNIGSTSARAGQPFLAASSISKGALATLTWHAAFAGARAPRSASLGVQMLQRPLCGKRLHGGIRLITARMTWQSRICQIQPAALSEAR